MGDAARPAACRTVGGGQAALDACAAAGSLASSLAVVAMIWPLIVVAVILVLALVGALAVGRCTAPPDAAYYRIAVELHGIRRRHELAEFKREVKRDAAQARRELREELDSLARREPKS